MKRLPYFQSEIKQFPWGRLESEGSFCREIARGRYGVLGGDGFGFWSHKGGPVPHQDGGPWKPTGQSGGYSEIIKDVYAQFYHLDGNDLLEKRHLTDVEGWKHVASWRGSFLSTTAATANGGERLEKGEKGERGERGM